MDNVDEIKKSQHRLIVIAILFLFLLFLGYTIIWEYNYFYKYGNFKKTKATVIEHYIEDGIKYDKFSYFIGEDKEVIKISSSPSTRDVGDEFMVYYDKNNEVEIIYKVDPKRWILPIVTSTFGWISIELMCVYLATYNKNKVRN